MQIFGSFEQEMSSKLHNKIFQTRAQVFKCLSFDDKMTSGIEYLDEFEFRI